MAKSFSLLAAPVFALSPTHSLSLSPFYILMQMRHLPQATVSQKSIAASD